MEPKVGDRIVVLERGRAYIYSIPDVGVKGTIVGEREPPPGELGKWAVDWDDGFVSHWSHYDYGWFRDQLLGIEAPS